MRGGAPQVSFVEIGEAAAGLRFSVLVTSLDETLALAQARSATAATQTPPPRNEVPMGLGRLHHARSRPLPARGAAHRAHLRLVGKIFVRLARPSSPPRGDHQPAVVPDGDRDVHDPRATNHDPRHERARQGRAGSRALAAVAAFLRGLTKNAEQLTRLQTWREILSRAFQAFLNGRLLRPPPRLAPS